MKDKSDWFREFFWMIIEFVFDTNFTLLKRNNSRKQDSWAMFITKSIFTLDY